MTASDVRRRPSALVLAAVAALVALSLTACTTVVHGQATHADGTKKDAKQSTLKIIGGDGGATDKLVANSLEDIFGYWKSHFQQDFGEAYKDISGGIYSYTPDSTDKIPCVGSAKEGADNAFYCPSADAIAYDRDFLGKLAKEYGKLIVLLVMAHEFGHAIQARVGDPGNRSIVVETQADCYAGVFMNAASNGTTHFQLTSDELDTVLAGYLYFRDDPGGSATQQDAHGSGFDRVNAFQDGYSNGVGACKSNYTDSTKYTEVPYTSATDQANKGNLPYTDTIGVASKEYDPYFTALLKKDGKSYPDVQDKAASGSISCDGNSTKDQVYYCAKDSTVYYDDSLMQKAYKLGDFAVIELFGLEYAQAAVDAAGSGGDDKAKFTEAVCLSGTYAGDAFRLTQQGKPTLGGSSLSAGDLDEAVAALLAIGSTGAVVDTYGVPGFQRVDAFRKGVAAGMSAPPSLSACTS